MLETKQFRMALQQIRKLSKTLSSCACIRLMAEIPQFVMATVRILVIPWGSSLHCCPQSQLHGARSLPFQQLKLNCMLDQQYLRIAKEWLSQPMFIILCVVFITSRPGVEKSVDSKEVCSVHYKQAWSWEIGCIKRGIYLRIYASILFLHDSKSKYRILKHSPILECKYITLNCEDSNFWDLNLWVLQFWCGLIQKAEKPNPLSARDGLLLKKIPPERQLTLEKSIECLTQAFQTQNQFATDAAACLVDAWSKGMALIFYFPSISNLTVHSYT